MEKHLVLGPYLAFGRSLKKENSELFEEFSVRPRDFEEENPGVT